MPTRNRNRLVLILTIGALSGLLVGCEPTPEPSESPSASSAPSPSESSSPSASPSAAPEEATAVTVACADVVSAQTMYDFNPNFGLLASFTPDAGSLAAQAVASKGIACRSVNQTSSATVDVSISHPTPSAFSAAKDAASSGTSVSGLGDAAFFSTSGGAGIVQVFNGALWITARSVFFSSAGDATSILTEAVAASR